MYRLRALERVLVKVTLETRWPDSGLRGVKGGLGAELKFQEKPPQKSKETGERLHLPLQYSQLVTANCNTSK